MAEATSNDASLWNQHSPLDTLVRRTSSKRFKQRTAVGYQLATSPLLHSHFARHSTATSSSNGDNSYYIDRSSMGSAATDGVYPPYQYDDDASIPGARAPPRSPSPNETMPVVVISSPGGGQTARPVSKGGRAPIAASAQLTANFSRPVRPPTLPPVNTEEQKRLVLERNAARARSGSPTSVYSGYSFYQLPPTPSNELPQPQLSQGNSSRARSPQPAPPPTITVTPSPSYQSHAPAPPGPPNLDNPQTPQDYLQLGIQAHEANKLRDSFDHFEQAAKLQGGCGVGMLMYGLSLRHGWGCEKNEKVGFKWLRRAAESAVEDLESARASKMMDVGAVQSELVLAIYEVGQCFFQGWGVPKDQKMAVSYYRVAARLGDPDAQQDLGFCLANGKGCKKDKKEAAKWYRAAVAQGISDVGLAWIFKEKYQ
ncbi:hypothetical protein PLEOSDRAFT_1062408 [Pleurotus ostreatus PC15]|uniref:HCP-like protein n=1 Tax=Pleurotus ostreatus (strain PC15) TaxID=1137138 RepID=A0A067NR34_PLEO1|nr:hypothetical protein PLEOSDRAFT_1062408 [Pleurotus ostreatus PC15]